MSISEKSLKSPEPENPSEHLEGATVVRKLDVQRLTREAIEAGKRTYVAKSVTLISLYPDTYLIAPAGAEFRGADGDSVNEDGISEVKARQTILSLFGLTAYLEPNLWGRIIHTVKSGAKVTLEVGNQPLVSPKADINGKFPIRIRG